LNKLTLENVIEETLSNKLKSEFIVYIYTNFVKIMPNEEISKDSFEELLALIETLFKTNNKSYEILYGNYGYQYIQIYDYDLSYFKKLIVFE
jgi:hypothetical protein